MHGDQIIIQHEMEYAKAVKTDSRQKDTDAIHSRVRYIINYHCSQQNFTVSGRVITFSTNSCIMVESWTEPFADLVTRRKLYYVITSDISTQMKVHRWQKIL